MSRPALVRIDSQRRYRALIDAATKLFLEFGYAGASMNQLVERAGGSKSSIYAYFRDKEGLFIAVIDDMVRDVLLPLHDLMSKERGLRESLTDLAERTLAELTSLKGLGLTRIVFAESAKLPAVGEAFYQHGPGRAMVELSEYLQHLVDSGEIRCEKTDMAAEFFWGMLLHRPMLQGHCGVARPMSARARKQYVAQVVGSFIDRFIE